MMHNCKAILFDLFGTLIDNPPRSVWDELSREISMILKIEYEEWKKLWSSQHNDRGDGVFQSIEENILHNAAQLNGKATVEAFEEVFEIRRKRVRMIMLEIRNDTISTLKRIKDAGFRTALVSDCSPDVAVLWDEMPYAQFIDYPVFSPTIKARKPDPLIYETAMSGLSVSASECIFVGDGGSFELTGAAKLGIKAVMIAQEGKPPVESKTYEGDRWKGAKISTISQLLDLILPQNSVKF